MAQYLNNTAYSVAMADNNTDVLAQFEGLPNPVLYLNQVVALQQAALLASGAPINATGTL